jgi:ubiquinone/menaquinone biosynthesis C-methylase UbiE
MNRADIDKLKPGASHYMAYVGPPKKYELIGKMQKDLLLSSGLLPNHKLLDIGCGSLRAGLHFIPYLDTECYFGIEPNKWLVEEGIKQNMLVDVEKSKKPTFIYNSNFELGLFNQRFNFMIAQSIFSHASIKQIKKCVSESSKVLEKGGLFLATFVLGKSNYHRDDWVYPGCVTYTNEFILDLIHECGMAGHKMKYDQKNGQTWYAIYHKENKETFIKRIP